MDVFYPSAGGNSIPGDPQNLDFSHCLGYYNYNKVRYAVVNPLSWCFQTRSAKLILCLVQYILNGERCCDFIFLRLHVVFNQFKLVMVTLERFNERVVMFSVILLCKAPSFRAGGKATAKHAHLWQANLTCNPFLMIKK